MAQRTRSGSLVAAASLAVAALVLGGCTTDAPAAPESAAAPATTPPTTAPPVASPTGGAASGSSGSTPLDPLRPSASTPAQRAVDKAVADALLDRFEDPALASLASALVIVDGRTVLEHETGAPGAYHHTWSVTKSVVATLIGLAIEDGSLTGLDQTLGELLPDHRAQMSPEVRRVTLEQLLTMTAGFSDTGLLSDDAPDTVASLLAAHDGEVGQFAYSNAGAHLVAAVLAEATGRTVLDYAQERLFDPLGIPSDAALQLDLLMPASWGLFSASGFAWGTDHQGINSGAFGLRLRAQDMARFGLMVLDGGRWEGRQVVPAGWVRAMTTTHVRTGSDRTPGYGYEWWIGDADGQRTIAALGLGGQVIAIVPSRDIVAVFQTETMPTDSADIGDELLAAIQTVIVPAYAP